MNCPQCTAKAVTTTIASTGFGSWSCTCGASGQYPTVRRVCPKSQREQWVSETASDRTPPQDVPILKHPAAVASIRPMAHAPAVDANKPPDQSVPTPHPSKPNASLSPRLTALAAEAKASTEVIPEPPTIEPVPQVAEPSQPIE